MGRQIGVMDPASIVAEVKTVLGGWKKVFSRTGVPTGDIARISPLLDQRLA